ncbi:MAG: hypothetical protein CL477_00355 [Acidobacteria bacterium]|nr:hypothetical protein [Acidobacteriota bacterium]MDP7340637.1 CHAD domain-containing protein [Vicinamibacterales bacterium]HJN45307.1 CHAD domain-containing protein [Vicinamibacterales bacterium]
MSRLHPLERPFRRHMGTFQRNLGPALEGEPEPLQRCYGATRRLRELAPLLAAEIGSAVVGETRVRLRRVGRALGPVREIDVALGLVGEWVADDRARQDAVEGLRQHLLDAGAVARERMTGQVESAQAATLARRMQAIGSALSASTTGIWSRTLSLRMTRRAQHLREVVEAAGALYLPDRVQAVRMAVEKLRYAFEFACDAGASRRRVPALRLTEAQELLSRLHDIEALIRLSQNVSSRPRSSRRAHLDELRHELEQECRRLHGAFISQRRQVVQACGAALDMAIPLWNRRGGVGSHATPLKMRLADPRIPRRDSKRRMVSS